MANHKSAKIRIRRNAKRGVINTSRLSSIRTGVKKVEQAIAAGDVVLAQKTFLDAQPAIDRGVAKKLLSKKSAARKLSRLQGGIKALKKKS